MPLASMTRKGRRAGVPHSQLGQLRATPPFPTPPHSAVPAAIDKAACRCHGPTPVSEQAAAASTDRRVPRPSSRRALVLTQEAAETTLPREGEPAPAVAAAQRPAHVS